MGIEPIILASQTNVLPLYHNYLYKKGVVGIEPTPTGPRFSKPVLYH